MRNTSGEQADGPVIDHNFKELVNRRGGGYKTVGEMVYGILREALNSGVFAGGEWLRQEALAEAIGVSRIPVRTALMQLESEGLVTFYPHRGARVRTLSIAEINEIYRLRMLLEPYALQQSMARMTPDRLERIVTIAGELDVSHDGSDFLETRIRFYREVYDAANNPMLVGVIEELRDHVGSYLLGFRVHHGEGGQHAHSELATRVASGDLAAGEAWLRAHLEDVRNRIHDLLSSDEAGAESKFAAPPPQSVAQ